MPPAPKGKFEIGEHLEPEKQRRPVLAEVARALRPTLQFVSRSSRFSYCILTTNGASLQSPSRS